MVLGTFAETKVPRTAAATGRGFDFLWQESCSCIFCTPCIHAGRARMALAAGRRPRFCSAQQHTEHVFIIFLPSPLMDFYTALLVNTGIPKNKTSHLRGFSIYKKIKNNHSYLISTISYSITPPGACTCATSSTCLPINARAIGEVTDIMPCFRSASSSPTIL